MRLLPVDPQVEPPVEAPFEAPVDDEAVAQDLDNKIYGGEECNDEGVDRQMPQSRCCVT